MNRVSPETSGSSAFHFARRDTLRFPGNMGRASAKFHGGIKARLGAANQRLGGRHLGNPLCHAGDKYTVPLSRRGAIAARPITSRYRALLRAPCVRSDLNHNGRIGSINLSQHAETVRGGEHAERARAGVVAARGGHGRAGWPATWKMSSSWRKRRSTTCAPSVGCGSRGLWV